MGALPIAVAARAEQDAGQGVSCVYCGHDLAEAHGVNGGFKDGDPIWVVMCVQCAEELGTCHVVCAVPPRAVFT